MAYNRNLVVSIKSKGRFLREVQSNERDREVFLAFGEEYSIYLKNLNSTRALVDVSIDGRKAIKGLVINPDNIVELERFYDGDNEKGYKFKFIEKNEVVVKNRGNLPEDGLIVISFKFEKERLVFKDYPQVREPWNERPIWPSWPQQHDPWIIYRGDTADNSFHSRFENSVSEADMSTTYANTIPVEDGITVEGSDSSQQFTNIYIDEKNFGSSNSIVIKLKGRNQEEVNIKKTVYVKTSIKCTYCGKMNSSDNSYCPGCGTRIIFN